MLFREPTAPQLCHRGVAVDAQPSARATLSPALERERVRRRCAQLRAALACQGESGSQDAIDASFAAARAARSCGRLAVLTLPRGSRGGVERSAKRCCYKVGATLFFRRRNRRQHNIERVFAAKTVFAAVEVCLPWNPSLTRIGTRASRTRVLEDSRHDCSGSCAGGARGALAVGQAGQLRECSRDLRPLDSNRAR